MPSALTTFGPRLIVGAVVLIAMLAVNIVIRHRNTTKLHETAGLVSSTHTVISALDRVLTSSVDAETGERGYLITGDERYLEPGGGCGERLLDVLAPPRAGLRLDDAQPLPGPRVAGGTPETFLVLWCQRLEPDDAALEGRNAPPIHGFRQYTRHVPIYEYACMECESHFEELVRSSDQAVTCPECGAAKVLKQLSSFAVHGAVSKPSFAGPTGGGGGCCGGSCGCGH